MAATIETINIEWLIDPQGQIQAKSAQHLQSVKALESEYERLGQVITGQEKTAVSVGTQANAFHKSRIDLLAQELNLSSRLTTQLREMAAANLNQGARALGPGQVGIAGPFNVTPRGSIDDRILLTQFNQAAQARNQIEEVNKSLGRVGQTAGTSARGVTVVGTAILSSFGIHYSRAIEIVANQILTAGDSAQRLRDILTSPTVIFAGSLAVLVGIYELTKKVREQEEAHLHAIEQEVAVRNRILLSAPGQVDTNLQNLREQLAEQRTAQQEGTLDPLKNTISELEHDIAQLESRSQRLGVIREQVGATNVVEDARKRLAELQNVPGVDQGALFDKMAFLRERFFQIGDVTAFNNEIDATLTRFGEMRKRFEDQAKAQEVFRKETEEANIALLSLRRSADDNPFTKLFDTADQRTRQFVERFKNIAPDLKEAFKKASDEILSTEIFKTGFGQAQGVLNLQLEAEKLRAGLGGADIRSQSAQLDAQRQALEQQISEARNLGDSDRLRALQDQFMALGGTTTGQRIEQDFRNKQLEVAQQFLQGAGNPQQQRFALDQILQLTSNIGQLTSEQQDLRLRALEQSIKLRETDISKVVIEIVDKSGGKIDSTVLGAAAPTPTPPPTAIQNDPSIFTTGLGLSQNF